MYKKLQLNEFTKKSDSKLEKAKEASYGQELILDIHEVPEGLIHHKNVRKFASELCDEIQMNKGPIHLWGEEKELHEYPDKPKIEGISCVQFLYSSSITIHALDAIGKVFINIFSCEKFDSQKAKKFSLDTWKGKLVKEHNIVRE